MEKQIKIETIITYKKKSGKRDQLFMNMMVGENITNKGLIDHILYGLMKFKKIGEERIYKIDCASFPPLPLFNDVNGNYYNFENKWYVGYGKKMPNDLIKEL